MTAAVLAAAAVASFVIFRKKSGEITDLRALLSLFWLGGAAVASLKLSRLSAPWGAVTWACILLFWALFVIGFLSGEKAAAALSRGGRGKEADREKVLSRLVTAQTLLMGASLAAFLTEAVVLGYLPILSDKPHAYSYFHLSGVHYFTVCCVLVPPLSVIIARLARETGRWEKKLILREAVLTGTALILPVLMVSRMQLIQSVALSVLVYLGQGRKLKAGRTVLLGAALLAVYVGLTFARHHDVEYLNGIFEMKNAATPIFVTQPYMYIANNYENFNVLVRDLPAHTHGLRQLFPALALTGLKFLHPEWVSQPLYVTKTELTTLTVIYDAYYDFGAAGVLLFGLVLGAACGAVSGLKKRSGNPAWELLYAQLALYMVLSFFTTWFSNPTTWFYFAVTALIGLFAAGGKRHEAL